MNGIAMGTEAWVWMGAWALVMVLVVWFLSREPRHGDHPGPAEILRDRFARGELSEEEYRRAIAALDDDPPGPVPATRHHARHGQEARHD